LKHLSDLQLEQVAEQRVDIDARKKTFARPDRWAARA
jgi:hypothetical protein